MLNGDNFSVDPLVELRKVETFLGLLPFFSEEHFLAGRADGLPCFESGERDRPSCMGSNKGRPHPQLQPETLAFLRQKYKPMLDQFYAMTGVQLSLL